MVGVSSREIVREETSSAVRDTHSPVNERLYLKRIGNVLPYLDDILHCKLTRENNSLCSELMPCNASLSRYRACLGGYVYLERRRYLTYEHDYTDVGYNNSVNSHLVKEADVVGQLLVFACVRHNVHRHIQLYVVAVAIVNRRDKLVTVKVGRCRAHTEVSSGKVHSVRTVIHRRLELFKISCGGKQLRFFTVCHQSSKSRQSLVSTTERTNPAASRCRGFT